MARFVREIMNRELFAIGPDARSDDTLDAILALGISAVPVLDDQGHPIGMTSIRDLVRGSHADHVTKPALSVSANTDIETAARTMADTDHHHLVVVGTDGRAVGMLSSLDVMRALVGYPAKHPSTFPHYDAALEVWWADDTLLDLDHLAHVPQGGGVLVLTIGGAKHSDRDVWVEATAALASRIHELLEFPVEDALLARILRLKNLQFRCAPISDEDRRTRIAQTIRRRIETTPLPCDEALAPPPSTSEPTADAGESHA